WALDWWACSKTARATSGWEGNSGCGYGDPILRNSIRCQVSRTGFAVLAKTMEAHYWSDGRAGSTDSMVEKPKPTHCRVSKETSVPKGSSAIAMAVCGSELKTGELCTYTSDAQMCLCH